MRPPLSTQPGAAGPAFPPRAGVSARPRPCRRRPRRRWLEVSTWSACWRTDSMGMGVEDHGQSIVGYQSTGRVREDRGRFGHRGPGCGGGRPASGAALLRSTCLGGTGHVCAPSRGGAERTASWRRGARRRVSPDSWWARDLWTGWSPLVFHLSALEEVLGRVASGREPLPAGAVHARELTGRSWWTLYRQRGRIGSCSQGRGFSAGVDAAGDHRGPGTCRRGTCLPVRGLRQARRRVGPRCRELRVPPGVRPLHMLFGEGCVVALSSTR